MHKGLRMRGSILLNVAPTSLRMQRFAFGAFFDTSMLLFFRDVSSDRLTFIATVFPTARIQTEQGGRVIHRLLFSYSYRYYGETKAHSCRRMKLFRTGASVGGVFLQLTQSWFERFTDTKTLVYDHDCWLGLCFCHPHLQKHDRSEQIWSKMRWNPDFELEILI